MTASDGGVAVATDILAPLSAIFVAAASEVDPVGWRSDLREVLARMAKESERDWASVVKAVAIEIGCPSPALERAERCVPWSIPALSADEMALEMRLFAGSPLDLDAALPAAATEGAMRRLIDGVIAGLYVYRRTEPTPLDRARRLTVMVAESLRGAPTCQRAVIESIDVWDERAAGFTPDLLDWLHARSPTVTSERARHV